MKIILKLWRNIKKLYTKKKIKVAKKYNFNEKTEFVDLGLSSGTLWCDRNLGAKYPSVSGNYYAWGDTESRECDVTKFTFDAYKKIYGDNVSDELTPVNDICTITLGPEYNIPTPKQFLELINECDWHFETIDSDKGFIVSSRVNGNFIFLPIVDIISENSFNYYKAIYWSNHSIYGKNPPMSSALVMTRDIDNKIEQSLFMTVPVFVGGQVRPVKTKCKMGE